jgi:predicted aspartyl protease
MKANIKAVFAAALLAMSLWGPAAAGPFEDGVAAANKGDHATALRLWRPLAAQGSAAAQFAIGAMYVRGQGVPQDYAEALKWYRLAASQGLAHAQAALGAMFNTGLGDQQDYAEAAKWYRLAAEQGLAQAQAGLGAMYIRGQGGPKNYTEAAKWLRLAAEQGYPLAQYYLGSMYVTGQGVAQDLVQAHKWLDLAASRFPATENAGRERAIRNRDLIAAKMTTEQIVEARRLSSECRRQNFTGCDALSSPLQPVAPTSRKSIALEASGGGTYVVPVVVNGVITLKFTIDSGAAVVTIPADVFLTLARAGTISKDDFLGSQTFTLADGSKVPSQKFRIRSLKVGDVEVQNVVGSGANVKGHLLLGQSFLSKLKSWSMDNQRRTLIIE